MKKNKSKRTGFFKYWQFLRTTSSPVSLGTPLGPGEYDSSSHLDFSSRVTSDSYIFWRLVQFPLSIPSGSAVKNPLAMQELQEMRLDPCVRKIPWRMMATHSSILAWRISWTEEPSGLQSIGSQRVGLDRRTWRAHTCSSPGITGAGQCLSNQRKTWEALLCILRLLSTSGPEPLGFRVFMVPTSMTNTS